MRCPNCNHQDSLLYQSFKCLVLQENKYLNPYSKKEHYTSEGEYFCPYGCGCQMLLVAIGSYDEINKISEKLTKKYPVCTPTNPS